MVVVNVYGKRVRRKERIPTAVLNAADDWALNRARELRLSGVPVSVYARPGEPLCVVYKVAQAQ
jgi:hypothetical protein